jgi:hypothetical protein
MQSRTLIDVIAGVHDREREEGDKALAERDVRIARLGGKIDALLSLLGQKEFKSGDASKSGRSSICLTDGTSMLRRVSIAASWQAAT